MVDEQPLDTGAFRMELSLPCDDRFRPILSELCGRMVRYLGYSETDATDVAAALVHATDGVVGHDESPAYSNLDLTISTSDTEVTIRLRYLPVDRVMSDGGPTLEDRLRSPHGDEVPLDEIHRVMARVEFGRDAADGVEFCTLSKALPDEPSSKPLPEPGPDS